MTEDDTYNRLRKVSFEQADNIWDDLSDHKELWMVEPNPSKNNEESFAKIFEERTGWKYMTFYNEWKKQRGLK